MLYCVNTLLGIWETLLNRFCTHMKKYSFLCKTNEYTEMDDNELLDKDEYMGFHTMER